MSNYFFAQKIRLMLILLLCLNGLSCNKEKYSNESGKITLHMQGGFSPLDFRIVTVERKANEVIVQVQEKWKGHEDEKSFERILSQKQYKYLWQILEQNDIWVLKDARGMGTDGFTYNISINCGKKSHHFSVYNPRFIERDDRYQNIVSAILNLHR